MRVTVWMWCATMPVDGSIKGREVPQMSVLVVVVVVLLVVSSRRDVINGLESKT